MTYWFFGALSSHWAPRQLAQQQRSADSLPTPCHPLRHPECMANSPPLLLPCFFCLPLSHPSNLSPPLLKTKHKQSICSFLPLESRCRARLVNSTWRRLGGEAVQSLGFSTQQLKTQVRVRNTEHSCGLCCAAAGGRRQKREGSSSGGGGGTECIQLRDMLL